MSVGYADTRISEPLVTTVTREENVVRSPNVKCSSSHMLGQQVCPSVVNEDQWLILRRIARSDLVVFFRRQRPGGRSSLFRAAEQDRIMLRRSCKGVVQASCTSYATLFIPCIVLADAVESSITACLEVKNFIVPQEGNDYWNTLFVSPPNHEDVPLPLRSKALDTRGKEIFSSPTGDSEGIYQRFRANSGDAARGGFLQRQKALEWIGTRGKGERVSCGHAGCLGGGFSRRYATIVPHVPVTGWISGRRRSLSQPMRACVLMVLMTRDGGFFWKCPATMFSVTRAGAVSEGN